MAPTRTLTTAFALGRLAFGAGLLTAPEKLAARWIGADATRPPVKIVLRAVGARDIALSAGALASLRDEDALRLWLGGALISDLCDVVSTLVTPPDVLPANARWGTVALGGGSALIGAALLAARGS
jgi:hypothetical protein